MYLKENCLDKPNQGLLKGRFIGPSSALQPL
jgi:hypothetical protein